MWLHTVQAPQLLPHPYPCLHIHDVHVYGVEAPVPSEATHHGHELWAWVAAHCEQLVDIGQVETLVLEVALLIDELLQVALLIRVHVGKVVQCDVTHGQGLHPNLLHPQQHDAPQRPDGGVLLLSDTGHWTWEPGHVELQSPDDGRRFLHLPIRLFTQRRRV